MKLNDALPRIDVDPETYDVTRRRRGAARDAGARAAAGAAVLPVLMTDAD